MVQEKKQLLQLCSLYTYMKIWWSKLERLLCSRDVQRNSASQSLYWNHVHFMCQISLQYKLNHCSNAKCFFCNLWSAKYARNLWIGIDSSICDNTYYIPTDAHELPQCEAILCPQYGRLTWPILCRHRTKALSEQSICRGQYPASRGFSDINTCLSAHVPYHLPSRASRGATNSLSHIQNMKASQNR